LRKWEEELNTGKSASAIGPIKHERPVLDLSKLETQLKTLPDAHLQNRDKAQWTLFVLRQGPTCDRCNQSEADFLSNWLDRFSKQGVQTVVVASEGAVPAYTRTHAISAAVDPKGDVFRFLGCWDHFDGAPSHG